MQPVGGEPAWSGRYLASCVSFVHVSFSSPIEMNVAHSAFGFPSSMAASRGLGAYPDPPLLNFRPC